MDTVPVVNEIPNPQIRRKDSSKYIIISLLILLIITIIGSTITIAILLSKDRDDKVEENITQEESKSCLYNNKTYKSGEGFPSTDGCNTCSCVNGEVVCTLMACLDNSTSEDTNPSFDSNTGDTVTIFLVAEGDNGASGELVGCGDSLVGVQVEIDPTTDLVKKALNKLFSIKEQYYGESGLKNSLYKSSLSVDYIDIQEDVVKVYLLGDVVSAGTCDNPRIVEQIKGTVRGFETSYPIIGGKTIEVYVNGELIEDVLSLK